MRAIRMAIGGGMAAAMAALAGCDAAERVAAPLRAGCEAAATVELAPGETAVLDEAAAACFSLAARPYAGYVLAGFDTRGMEAARAGVEPGALEEPEYSIVDLSRGGGPAAPSASRAPGTGAATLASVGADAVLESAQTAADPFRHGRPWSEGERFAVGLPGRPPEAARVVRVRAGVVLAVVEADEGPGTARVVQQASEALETLAADGFSTLRATFGEAAPVTSAGSGQLLVVLDAWDPGHGAGGAVVEVDPAGGGVRSWLRMNLQVRPGVRPGFETFDHATYRLKVLAHEMTHAWQLAWLHEATPGGLREVPTWPRWGIEGAADLVAMDVVRRSLGIPLTGNWAWSGHLDAADRAVTFALEPADTRGRLPRGYFDASSFLRDLQVRMVRAGVPADAAMREVARGAVEGWWGGEGAPGLAGRVRARLGSAWEPADAVLLWTAAQGADDLSAIPALNNEVYADAGHPGNGHAWRPATGDLHAAGGFSVRTPQGAGGSFYVRLWDSGVGGTYSARSSRPGARWMLARFR